MENIVEMFHIDIKLVIAQMANFVIVFFVLFKFVISPLQQVMKERTEKIEKSLEDAKSISAKLDETKKETDNIIAAARKEADEILEEAKSIAEKKQEQSVEKARQEIAAIIKQEKERMENEKIASISEIKKEIANFVVSSVEKVIGEKVDTEKDREIINRVISKH